MTENLQRQGLSAKKAAKNLNLTHAMVDKRLAWCRQIGDWTEGDWMKVKFSDESTFYQIRNCILAWNQGKEEEGGGGCAAKMANECEH